MRLVEASLGVINDLVPGTTFRSKLSYEPEGIDLPLRANNFDGCLPTELSELGRIDTGYSESRIEIGKTRIQNGGSPANFRVVRLQSASRSTT